MACTQLPNSKLVVVLAVVALLAGAHRLGIIQRFSDPAGIVQALLELHAWGYVVFILAYAALQPFGVPGTVFVMAAPLIWPWPVAFVLSMVGTMAASVIGFSFARFVARDAVTKLVPERFRKYERALDERAFATVFVLRLVFWMPQVLHTFFGVSRVRFWTHFWGSLFGYVLPLFLVSFFGQRLFELMREFSLRDWLLLAPASAALLFGVWRLSRRFERS